MKTKKCNAKPFSLKAIVMKAATIVNCSFLFLSALACPALASPVATTNPTDATRNQPHDVARCIVAAVHYVRNESNYERIRWSQDNPDAIHKKSYYHDGSQLTEITITAEGHVRDLKFTDTYEAVNVYCMEIDNRLSKLNISPVDPQ